MPATWVRREDVKMSRSWDEEEMRRVCSWETVTRGFVTDDRDVEGTIAADKSSGG